MADAKPRITLVDEYFQSMPAAKDAAEGKQRETERSILARHAGAIISVHTAREGAKMAQDAKAKVFTELGAKGIEDLRTMPKAIAEVRASYAAQTKHHGAHQWWRGACVGLAFGALFAAAGIAAMQGVIWDTAVHAFREQAMTGALISGARPHP